MKDTKYDLPEHGIGMFDDLAHAFESDLRAVRRTKATQGGNEVHEGDAAPPHAKKKGRRQ